MIHLRDVHLAFGGEPLFEGLTWSVRHGERVGLIGPNGAGKSTLLRIMTGEQTPDAGEVAREGTATVGYLAQDIQELDLARTPVDEAMEAFSDVKQLEAQAERLTKSMEEHPDHTSEAYLKLVERFSAVQSQLVAREAHTAETRAASILSGLGFTANEMERPLSTFSGGWRMRVALARMLLKQPTVLLLDEPTNHLDLLSIDWLEDYLQRYEGAVVLVSHDRTFLDRMTTQTAELVRGHIEEYSGNYAYYLQEREERRAIWRATYENQQKLIADTERFIERFRYKATKASQVQSRIKMLDKLKRVPPPPPEQGEIHFRFPDPPRSTRTVVEIGRFSKTYPTPEGGTNDVFTDAGPLTVERGDKIALVGRNGAGKSTLARMLLGTESFEGPLTVGQRTETAFFAQHQAEALSPDQTVLEALREASTGAPSETELRSVLGAFLFTGDDVFKPVHVLSGGERSRLALARTLSSPANFLILDEPTNHLDIASKDVLAEALRQYAGAFVIISHDRHFVEEVADQVWFAEDETVRTYHGQLSEVMWRREHGTASKSLSSSRQTSPEPNPASSSKKKSSASSSGGKKTKADRRREAKARNRLYRALRNGEPIDVDTLGPEMAARALEVLEAQVDEQAEKTERLERALADPDLYKDQEAFQEALHAFQEAEAELQTRMERWETLALEIEAET